MSIRVLKSSLVIAAALAATAAFAASVPDWRAGWGIDGCLTAFADDAGVVAYLARPDFAPVTVLRDRGPTPRQAALKAAGRRVVSFLDLGSLPPANPGDQLPGDLLATYHAAAAMVQKHAAYVDVWSMVNEPDVGYCRDLPERTVAFQKAVYLGIKDGAAAAGAPEPVVLMGALALPPGPWLDRATRNGLLDYTDAYDFHYYGRTEDLRGVTDAHRAFLRDHLDLSDRRRPVWPRLQPGERGWRHGRPAGPRSANARPPALPLWISECGINAIAPGDFFNADRRRLQAAFTRATALEAWRTPDVAVFMPFVLLHQGDPFALTLGPDRVLPAWTAYADVAATHRWPDRPLTLPPRDPGRVVPQWMPALGAAVPHKVAGTYRFVGDRPMRGEVRLYNLSASPVRGRLSASEPRAFRVRSADGGPALPPEVDIPAFGVISLPVEITPAGTGWFREEWTVEFVTDGDTRPARLSFGVERTPRAADFEETSLVLSTTGGGNPANAAPVILEDTGRHGPWRFVNGLLPAGEEARADGRLTVRVDRLQLDPLRPTLAEAALDGLPADGVLRLQLDRPAKPTRRVRVDLLDREGRRFSIWENAGAGYAEPGDDLWLNLRDFHPHFWGRSTTDNRFDPAQVVAIQIRFHLFDPADAMTVRLSLLRPR